LTCVGGECARFCCADSDCGAMAKCDMTAGPMDNEHKVGVCVFQ
jgi:hypothetical protein